MYPKITASIEKLKHNINIVQSFCRANGIDPMLVTKCFMAEPKIMQQLDDLGFPYFADSRIQNLERILDLKTPKILMRLPMISEISKVVSSDIISMNSEFDTVLALNNEAAIQNKIAKIIIMVDLGDIREGILEDDEIFEFAKNISKLSNIKIIGVASNLSCFGAIRPTEKNQTRLAYIANEIEKQLGIKMELISGGGSSAFYLVGNGMPKGINSLRFGEAFLFGTEASFGNRIENTFDDVFVLSAQIIEIKTKPTVPIGEIGFAAFRTKPTFEDRGNRKRVILAVGKQDIEISGLKPINKKEFILGASSDHLIVDVEESDVEYKVGDIVRFKMTYPSVMRAFTSSFVTKEYLL